MSGALDELCYYVGALGIGVLLSIGIPELLIWLPLWIFTR